MTLAIAHRGDTIRYRENTLPAIRSAMAEGAGMVTIDLKLTADRHVIALREETVGPSHGPPQPVSELTLAELAAMNAETEQRVPTLMEVLSDTSRPRPVPLMLEVRSVDTALAAETVLNEHGLSGYALYTGPVETMRSLRTQHPGAQLALTWDQPTLPPAELWEDLRPRFYNSHHSLVTREIVTEAHRNGYAVSAWTVNEFPEMARLMGMGIDAIMTDYPSDLVKLSGDEQLQHNYHEGNATPGSAVTG
ncbi:glycerophosphoryl diester phosphodiesterase [Haloactinospora alba]|uniref:Glycerophosphoryl diester phosphodiesterase n=1 Tax=Haloactinospora alba TaxID=405555 RepID=A0A543NHF1_9ACTN|nr:glycerophosphodiester phosphodiesterase [Haloactinospora alba]TQN31194.1 glycerophosphoryl diester phosphodiesterase [Haloactinospora alba]